MKEIRLSLLFIFSIITLILAWVFIERYQLPYTSEGSYFDEQQGVVYDEDAMEAYGFLTATFFILTLATFVRVVKRKVNTFQPPTKEKLSKVNYIAFILLFIAQIAFFLIIWTIHKISIWDNYHSWLEEFFILVLLIFAVLIAYTVTINQYKNKELAKKLGSLPFIVIVVGSIAYSTYHLLYNLSYKGSLYVSDFMGIKEVLPYHKHFGSLFYPGMIIISFTLLGLSILKLWFRMLTFSLSIIGFAILMKLT